MVDLGAVVRGCGLGGVRELSPAAESSHEPCSRGVHGGLGWRAPGVVCVLDGVVMCCLEHPADDEVLMSSCIPTKML